MKKNIAFMLILLCTVSLFIVITPVAFSQTTNLKVLSYSWYTSPSTGNLIVVGELQNIGSDILSSARVKGIIYTTDGQAHSSPYDWSQIYGSYLMPNQTAPFYMDFYPKNYTEVTDETTNNTYIDLVTIGIDHVEFYFYGTTTEEQPYSGLTLAAHDSYIDVTGNFSITGVVLNRGTGYPENVWAVASYYNSSGTIIAVGYSNYITPHHTPGPNQTALFTLIPTSPTPEMATQIASFNVQILSSGSTTSPTPSPPPTASPSPSTSPSTSSSLGTTASPSPGTSASSEPGVYLSMNTVYTILAVVFIVVIIVVTFILVRRKSAKA